MASYPIKPEQVIVITGAAGFIGSGLAGRLNAAGQTDLLLADDFSDPKKRANWENKWFALSVDREDLPGWFRSHPDQVDFVFHIGARTDTTEFDVRIFDRLNLDYSKTIWDLCTEHRIPLVYASSAATYGMGEQGYADNHEGIPSLKPLNPYGESKQAFDEWVLKQAKTPPFWAGLKFFNVYGPNEYHKGRMASVIFHAFHQIREQGKVKLFRSHHPDYKDGGQLRDFVYVKDVLDVCLFLMENKPASGIYNLGSGTARTFADLANAVFDAMHVEPVIEYIDTPEDIRDKYQYFTQAEMGKLRQAGYTGDFHSLEAGVADYVRNYLTEHVFL